jgi:REP element-mobilizing transposase RayT
MVLNDAGRLIDECWREIPRHFANVELAAHIVMPNHIHGIVVIRRRKDRPATNIPGSEPKLLGAHAPGSLPAIVRSFKAITTRRIRECRGRAKTVLWQRGYYEHVIRNAVDFDNVSVYIKKNPVRWDSQAQDSQRFPQL